MSSAYLAALRALEPQWKARQPVRRPSLIDGTPYTFEGPENAIDSPLAGVEAGASSTAPPPQDEPGQFAMLPSLGMLGDWARGAASAIGGGGVGNYQLPAIEQAPPPSAPAHVEPPLRTGPLPPRPAIEFPMPGVESGSSSTAEPGGGVPSITQDKDGRLVSSGAVPKLSASQVPESIRSGAYQPGPDWGTPDVSMAGMERDQRARDLIQSNYEKRNAAIDYPEDYARERGAEDLKFKELEAKARAIIQDPTGSGAYRERKAIDQTAVLDQQQAMLESIGTHLAQIDERATGAADAISRIQASALPDAHKRQLMDRVRTRAGIPLGADPLSWAEQAKREYQQSVGLATGKGPASLYKEGI